MKKIDMQLIMGDLFLCHEIERRRDRLAKHLPKFFRSEDQRTRGLIQSRDIQEARLWEYKQPKSAWKMYM